MKRKLKFTACWEYFFICSGCLIFALLFLFLVKNDDMLLRELPNKHLLLINLACVSLFGLFFYLLEKHHTHSSRKFILLLVSLYALLFIIQILLVNQTYFYTGWDVGTMQNSATVLWNGGSMQETEADIYYSRYPNNILMLYITYLIGKTGLLFSMQEPYNLCIYVSCFCVAFSCFLGNLILKRLTQGKATHILYILISTPFILLSPWIMMPYTDTFGMLFVTVAVWGLLCVNTPWLKWPAVGFGSVLGYYIKPTCLIVFLAAMLIYGIYYLTHFRREWKNILALAVSASLFWSAGACVPMWVQHTFNFYLDPEMRAPFTHYLMMGANPGSSGGYSGYDAFNTFYIPTYEERKAETTKEFIRRISGPDKQYLKNLYSAKALKNFNDGTFAWSFEGGFFLTFVEHSGPVASFFWNTFVPPNDERLTLIQERVESFENTLQVTDPSAEIGTRFTLYRTVAQGFWLQVLLGIPPVFLQMKRNRTEKACLLTMLCGLLAFVMLFEARARYLFLYAPIFLILSLCGYDGLFVSLKSLREKRIRRKS